MTESLFSLICINSDAGIFIILYSSVSSDIMMVICDFVYTAYNTLSTAIYAGEAAEIKD